MQNGRAKNSRREREETYEIAIVGDLTEREPEIAESLLDVPVGGQCVLYFDSPGGSSYAGLSLFCLMRLRGLDATGVVMGECSSAALWPFAACGRRFVTPFSLLLFHPMKWQSEEHVGRTEAIEWARYFGQMEGDMDVLLAELLGVDRAKVDEWCKAHKHMSGHEFAAAGLAELIDPRTDRLTRTAKRAKKPSGG